jgi:hypothetical protein
LASMTEEHTEVQDSQVHILRVYQQLVLRKDIEPGEAKARAKLVKAFCRTFFQETVSVSWARRAGGQEALRLTCAMFDFRQYDIAAMEQEFGTCVTDIIRLIPDYLTAWAHDFPSMSYKALTLLHNVSRLSVAQSVILLGGVKTKLESLLAGNLTTFELYPEAIQRLCVSVVVMIGNPSASTLQYFGQICSRSRRLKEHVSSSVLSFILQSFHSIRKELPMQAYLSFVMDTTGLTSCTDKALNNETKEGENHPWLTMLSYDLGILEASQCYVDCGASRVIKMVIPLLSLWLEQCHDPKSLKSCDLLRLRAALAMLCLFHMDMQEHSGSSVWSILPSERTLVSDAIVDFLCNAPALDGAGVTHNDFSRWTKPVRVLLSTDASLLLTSFSALCAKVVVLDSKSQIAAVACLSHLAYSRRSKIWQRNCRKTTKWPVLVRDCH